MNTTRTNDSGEPRLPEPVYSGLDIVDFYPIGGIIIIAGYILSAM